MKVGFTVEALSTHVTERLHSDYITRSVVLLSFMKLCQSRCPSVRMIVQTLWMMFV